MLNYLKPLYKQSQRWQHGMCLIETVCVVMVDSLAHFVGTLKVFYFTADSHITLDFAEKFYVDNIVCREIFSKANIKFCLVQPLRWLQFLNVVTIPLLVPYDVYHALKYCNTVGNCVKAALVVVIVEYRLFLVYLRNRSTASINYANFLIAFEYVLHSKV